jgi:hypothetical protein
VIPVIRITAALGLLLGAFIGSAQAQLPPARYPAATQPLNGQDAVLMDQGSGCLSGIAPCTTKQSPSTRVGQPIQTNCAAIASPFQYQQCDDTSVSPVTRKIYIGTTWFALYTLGSAGPTFPGIQLPSVATNAALQATVLALYPNGVWRNGFTVAGDAPPLFYLPSNSACSLNAGLGDNGSQVQSADGKCWLAVFPPAGIDFREFGADATGVSDAAPPINAALALAKTLTNPHFILSPGTYTIRTTGTGPYPLVSGVQGIQLYCASGAPCSFTLDGYGAVITAATAVANSNWIGLDYVQHATIRGLTFLANPAGWPTSSMPSAFFVSHLTDMKFEDMYLSGNWGGSTRSPIFLAGNWLSDVEFNRIKMPAQAQCFDLGFLRGVSFHFISAVGANDAGTTTGGGRGPCITNEYDAAFATNYPAAVTFSTSLAISIDATNNISNFGAGIFLRAGGPYYIAAASYNNPGTNSTLPNTSGAGVLLYNDTSVCCVSTTDPVHDVRIVGAELSTNGTGIAGAGVIIDGHLTNSGEQITNVLIDGTNFANNTNTAVKTIGPNVSGLVVGSNQLTGANQTTTYDATTLSLGTFNTFRSVLTGVGANATLAAGQTGFIGPSGVNIGCENCVWQVMPFAGYVTTLRAKEDFVPGGAASVAYTLRKNGVSTGLTCTVTAAVDTCTSSAAVVTYAAGDTLDVMAVASVGAASIHPGYALQLIAP